MRISDWSSDVCSSDLLLSLAGVLAVVARGDPGVLTGLRFASGDLWAAAAMAAWAVYSILLRHRPSALPIMARFTAVAAGCILHLLPFSLAGGLGGGRPGWYAH